METTYDALRRKARDRRKTARYGAKHHLTRKLLAPFVMAGLAYCANPACGELIEPGEPWDLGHNPDGIGYRGPEHARCNRGEPGRNKTSRTW